MSLKQVLLVSFDSSFSLQRHTVKEAVTAFSINKIQILFWAALFINHAGFNHRLDLEYIVHPIKWNHF